MLQTDKNKSRFIFSVLWSPFVLLIVTSTLSISQEWTWKPDITSFTSSINGSIPQKVISFESKTDMPEIIPSPVIEINPNDYLEVENVTCALFPSAIIGGFEVKKRYGFGDIPKTNFPTGRLRLRATIRKYWGIKSKDELYDEENEVLSEWFNLGVLEEQEIPNFKFSSYIEKNWDYLRIQIQSEAIGSEKPKILSELIIELRPNIDRFGYNVRHNIFSWLAVEYPIINKIVFGFFFALLLGLLIIGFIAWKKKA